MLRWSPLVHINVSMCVVLTSFKGASALRAYAPVSADCEDMRSEMDMSSRVGYDESRLLFDLRALLKNSDRPAVAKKNTPNPVSKNIIFAELSSILYVSRVNRSSYDTSLHWFTARELEPQK